MARRPDFGKREDVMSENDLKALNERLAHLSEPAVLDFYQQALMIGFAYMGIGLVFTTVMSE